MLPLPTAIKVRLDSIDGGIEHPKNYFLIAPAGADGNLPYRVIQQNPGTPPEFSSDQNEATEVVTIVVNVYGYDAVWVYEDLRRIEKSFVTTPLQLDSGSVILTEPGSHTVELDPERDDETGKEVYHGIVMTDFTVQRTLQD